MASALDWLDFKLRIYDLSVGGCLVDSLTEISSEQPIRLRIALPDASTREMLERAIDDAQAERSQN